MKHTFVSREGNDVKFTIDITADEIEAAKILVYQQNKDKFPVDGFRKGKAPRSIIEKKYGDVFVEDAVNNILLSAYPMALEELDIEVIDAPRTEFSPIESGKDLTVTVTVAAYPEVKIENYKGVEVEEEIAEVTDADLDAELQMMQYRSARIESVDRPAENGDTVILDFEGFIDGEAFDGGAAENFSLVLGSGSFIPGFEDQLVGMSAEESKDVIVTFPEDYQAEELAGKEATFKCTIHEVKTQELPELDDEFAKDVSEFDTLEELKEEARKNILEAKKNTAESLMKDHLVRTIAESNKLEIPESMVLDEINNMEQEMDNQLRQQGVSLPQYLEFAGKDQAAFREELRDNAVRRVENRMVIRGIADQEGFDATEDEIEEQMDKMAEQFGLEKDRVRELIGEDLRYLKQDVIMQKAIDFMYENAVKVPKKEEPAKDEAPEEAEAADEE